MKNKQKEWQTATKPLVVSRRCLMKYTLKLEKEVDLESLEEVAKELQKKVKWLLPFS
jgi:hypothetical protein